MMGKIRLFVAVIFTALIVTACGGGGGSSSSNTNTNTGTAPRAFDLNTVGSGGTANGATNVSLTPELEWTNTKQVGDPTQTYTLQISSNTTFSAPLVYENTSIADQTTSLTLPAGTLTKATTYYWRVLAVNTIGQTIASNAPWSFTTSSWQTSTIVSAGPANGQLYNATTTAIAHDSSNKIHVAYVDYSNSNLGVKYATNASGSWQITTIGDGTDNYNPVIAVDSLTKVHIFYDEGGVLKYATNETGAWQTITITSPSGYIDGLKSIAIDSNDKIHLSYLGNGQAEVRYLTNTSGTWQTTIVDSVGTGNVSYTSLALDANNKAYICYSGSTTLKYATNLTGSWQVSTVDTATAISGATEFIQQSMMAIDHNNNPHIIYQYSGNDYSGFKHAMNSSGSWTFENLTGISGSGPSIAVDAQNNIYFGGTSLTSNSSGSWKTEAITGGSAGSMTIDSLKYGHLVYYEQSTGNLKYETNAP